MNKLLIPALCLLFHSAVAQAFFLPSTYQKTELYDTGEGVAMLNYQIDSAGISKIDTTYLITGSGTVVSWDPENELQSVPNREHSKYYPNYILPAPGFRYNLYYWNARWWTEYEYLTLPKVQPLCILKYFADDDTQAIWLDNVRMSDDRFRRIADIFKDEKFYAQCCGTSTDLSTGVTNLESIHFVAPGPVGQTTIDLETMRIEILRAILQSRK